MIILFLLIIINDYWLLLVIINGYWLLLMIINFYWWLLLMIIKKDCNKLTLVVI